MCSYDDGDYEWVVDGTFREACIVPVHCEDCGRLVEPDEMIVRYTCVPWSEWDDERPYVFIVFRPRDGRRYYLAGDPYVTVIDNEDANDPRIDAFEALGFSVEEERDPRIAAETVPDHYTCVQCKAAERWLTEVCDQHDVLVTKYDLIDHLNDYDAATLGSDFVTLTTLARTGWRHPRFDRIVPERVVARLTNRAIKHAQLVGLHPD